MMKFKAIREKVRGMLSRSPANMVAVATQRSPGAGALFGTVYHLQDYCPLYQLLPLELRLLIFKEVVSAYLDPTRPYPFDSYWYRPNYTASKRTDLALLRTCKIIYDEAKDLVWTAGTGNEQEAFWLGDVQRRPGDHRLLPSGHNAVDAYDPRRDTSRRISAFQFNDWGKLTKIHVFAQMYAFKPDCFQTFFEAVPALRPRTVQITVRYTDWWFWETNHPLSLESIRPRSRGGHYVPESCEELVLELEMVKANHAAFKAQVESITKNQKLWQWKRSDGQFLELDDGGVREWEWDGTTRFGGNSFPHHPDTNTMRYVVNVLTFRVPPTSLKSKEIQPSDVASDFGG